MSRKAIYLLLLAMCALVLTSLPAAIAQEPGPDDHGGRLDGIEFTYSGASQDLRVSGYITALVELDAAPAAEALVGQNREAINTNRFASQRSMELRAQQESFGANLRNTIPGLQVIGNMTWLNNGIVVTVDASHMETIRGMDGVRGVYPDVALEVQHDTSLTFMDVPGAWTSLVDGAAGEGISISIVDDGIDYYHANFGGAGDPADYAADDRTIIEPGTFPTTKVAGGFDFVGENWDNTPLNPDPDPLPCGTHGSHVAGSAGGTGVVDDMMGGGVSYTGPYDATTPVDTMIIAPGVAPEATLYALKIGDCAPSVSGIAGMMAWDWSMDPNGDGDPSDRVHVINNSWGGYYASLEDPTVRAANLAAAADMVIVFAAGNRGDYFFIQDQTADGAITVANTYDDGVAFDALVVESADSIPANTTYTVGTADFGAPTTDLAGTVVAWDGGMDDPGNLACDPNTDMDNDPSTNPAVPVNAAAIAGNIALINRGGCAFTHKVLAAEAAGATGAIIHSTNDDLIGMTGAAPFPTIPSVLLGLTNGNELRADAGPVVVSFQENVVLANTPDIPSASTSRGPRAYDGESVLIKPDLSAPGTRITSTNASTGYQSLTISGTSMASPHVAGAAALIRQINPDWSVYDVKAALINTANNNITTEDGMTIYGVTRTGAGRMDVGSAAATDVIAYNTRRPDQVSVSFGNVEVVGTATADVSITVENLGATAASYDVSVVEFTSVPGVTFSVAPTTVNVPAGGTALVTLTMNADAATMQYTPEATLEINEVRRFLAEASGVVQLTATATGEGVEEDLRVAYGAWPRPAASITTPDLVEITPDMSGMGTFDIAMTGTGVDTTGDGVDPNDVLSVVTAYELGDYDGCDVSDADDFLFGNNSPWFADALDIEYVGMTTDFPTAPDLASTIGFVGISTCGDWASQFNTSYRVYLDVDNDFSADLFYWIQSTGPLGVGTNGNANDNIAIWACTTTCSIYSLLPPNWVWATDLDTYVYDNSVIMIPILATDLVDAGLDVNTAVVNYYAASFYFPWFGGPQVDFTDWATYDIDDAAYDLTQGIVTGVVPANSAIAADGENYTVSYDVSGGEIPDILLLHHHNSAETGRAEVVQVLELPATVSPDPDQLQVIGDLADAPVNPSFYWEHRTSDTDPTLPGEWYNVIVWDANDASNIVMDDWYDAAIFCNGPTCEVPTGPSSGSFFNNAILYGLAAGDYNWGVNYWSTAGGLGTLTEAPDAFTAAGSAPMGTSINSIMDGGTVVGNNALIGFPEDPDAAWYNIEVTGPVSYNEWYLYTDICSLGTCGDSFDFYADGDYTANVSVWNVDATDIVAGTAVNFSVDNSGITVAEVVLVAPAAASTTTASVVHFVWETQSEVEWYNLIVANAGGVVANEWYRCDFVDNCSTRSVDLVNGDYTWYVAGYSNNGGIGSYGTGSTFTLDMAAPGEINVLTPVDGTTYTREDLTVAWENNGAWYEMWVGDLGAGNTVFYQWFRRDDSFSGDLNVVANPEGVCINAYDDPTIGLPGDADICELDVLVPDAGTYEVWMRSWNSAGLGPWTTTPLSFTIVD